MVAKINKDSFFHITRRLIQRASGLVHLIQHLCYSCEHSNTHGHKKAAAALSIHSTSRAKREGSDIVCFLYCFFRKAKYFPQLTFLCILLAKTVSHGNFCLQMMQIKYLAFQMTRDMRGGKCWISQTTGSATQG